MLSLKEFIKNSEKTSICIDITSSLKKKTWDREKGIGTGDEPLLARTVRKFFC